MKQRDLEGGVVVRRPPWKRWIATADALLDQAEYGDPRLREACLRVAVDIEERIVWHPRFRRSSAYECMYERAPRHLAVREADSRMCLLGGETVNPSRKK